jgi:hypothetical protein
MNPMLHANGSAFLLVREGAVLPPDLPMENAAFLPGWRVVKNFDNYAFRQKTREANWRFLHLRGGKETRVVGCARQEILRRGVARILTDLKGRKFNSLEITVLGSKRFLGMIFLNIAVNLRHFQYNTAVLMAGGRSNQNKGSS